MPFAPSVSTSSAPYAFCSLRLSMLMVSGITSTTLYPSAAPTIAAPMPVLPLVGSTMTSPFFSVPSFCIPRIIFAAILSFTEPPGLKNSSFA